jgi:thioester reductase-like protein
MKRGKRTILLTGGTGFIGRRLVKKLLADKKNLLYLLVRRASWGKAEKMLQQLQREIPDAPQRVQLVQGDISRPLLIDDKVECLELQKKVQEIFHLAANYQLGISKQAAIQANVDGTLHMLDFARGCQKLRLVNYVSTLAVAGDYRGKWHEDMLLAGQQFDNYYAYTKFLAEVEVRAAMDELPIAVYRPGIVVGDSISGEMDKVDGPYYLLLPFLRLQKLTAQISPLIPIIFPLAPGGSRIKCHVAPVDYVVNCLDYISRQKDVEGKTFSLTDPKPLSVRQFLEVFCERAGWIKPLVDVDTQLLVWLLRLPGIKELSHSLEVITNVPVEMVHYTAYATEYDTANVQQILVGSGISCPSLRSYAGKLLAFARQNFV